MSTLTRIQFSRALALATHYRHWWACIGGYPLTADPNDGHVVHTLKIKINGGFANDAVEVDAIHDLARILSGKEGAPLTLVDGEVVWLTASKRLMWWVGTNGTVRFEVQRPNRQHEAEPVAVARATLSTFNKLTVEHVDNQPMEARHVRALEEAVGALLHDDNHHRGEFAPLWGRIEDFDRTVQEIVDLGREQGAACLTPVEQTTNGLFSTAISVPQAEQRLRRLWGRLAYLHDARRKYASASLQTADA